MSLTYQEISKQQKKRVDLLKGADPKKAEQVERLGMGVGVRAWVVDIHTFTLDFGWGVASFPVNYLILSLILVF